MDACISSLTVRNATDSGSLTGSDTRICTSMVVLRQKPQMSYALFRNEPRCSPVLREHTVREMNNADPGGHIDWTAQGRRLALMRTHQARNLTLLVAKSIMIFHLSFCQTDLSADALRYLVCAPAHAPGIISEFLLKTSALPVVRPRPVIGGFIILVVGYVLWLLDQGSRFVFSRFHPSGPSGHPDSCLRLLLRRPLLPESGSHQCQAV